MSEQNLNENNDDMSLNSAEENFDGADATAVADDDSGERYETLEIAEFEDDGRETMIKVDHVSMEFNMASEKLNNLKEYAISLAKGNLFFESFKALDDISFEVKRGDVFGILGTNGSGKSTLLKIIAGVLSPTSGKCEINGNIAPLIELGAGFDMDLSARENIYLNGSLLGYSKKFIDQHFDEIVEFAEIEKFLDMPMKNYSSGMIARIAFAIATVIVPEILIVDEVLSVGDFMFQQKCEDRINDLINNHGVTVLLVSHSNDQIERLCNKAIWIEKGHTRILGDAPLVCDTYRVLAGKNTTIEEEQNIIKVLHEINLASKSNTIQTKTFSGDSYFQISAELVLDGWSDGADNVILAPAHTHAYALMSTSLAGALDAPVIPHSIEEATHATYMLLAKLKPKTVYVVDDKLTYEKIIRDEALIGTCHNFVHIPLPTSDLAGGKGIIKFGLENNLMTNTEVFLCYFSDIIASLIIAPLIYISKCPLIIIEDKEVHLNDETIELLNSISAHRINLIQNIANSQIYNQLKGLSYDVQSISYDKKDDISNLYTYIANRIATKRKSTTCCVANSNLTHWAELFTAPSYAGKISSFLILEDYSQITTLITSINIIKNAKANSVCFIGNKGLTSTDKKILSAGCLSTST